MAATIGAIVIDAIDVDRVAAFWASLLGWEYGKDDDGDVVVADPVSYTHLDVYKRQAQHPAGCLEWRSGPVAVVVIGDLAE